MRIYLCAMLIMFVSTAATSAARTIPAQKNISIEDSVYRLNFNNGHYFFNAVIEDIPVEDIFLESAIPGILIGDELFEKTFNCFGLDNLEKQKGKKIVLLNNLYDIKYIHPITLNINDGVFTGNVFVLESYDKLALPVQNFTSKNSSKSYLKIDIPGKEMEFLSEDEWDKTDYKQFELECINGFPVVSTNLTIESNGKTGTIPNSRYIIDFGNGSLAFLMKGNKDVDFMLNNSGIEVFEAKNRDGQVISEAFMADTFIVCGHQFENQPIGVTDKMKTFQVFSGLIGLKFFTVPVIFDFKQGKFYIHK